MKKFANKEEAEAFVEQFIAMHHRYFQRTPGLMSPEAQRKMRCINNLRQAHGDLYSERQFYAIHTDLTPGERMRKIEERVEYWQEELAKADEALKALKS